MTAAKEGWDANPDTSFQVNWTTNWCTDEESWHARGFAHSEDAEAWARKLTKENEGNERFWLIIRFPVGISFEAYEAIKDTADECDIEMDTLVEQLAMTLRHLDV